MRLRIEYFDGNDVFAALLPREGMVVATPQCADSELAWHLVRLDAPLTYEGTEYSRLLVASRWRGHAIRADAATSVFILVVPSTAVVADGFSYKSFRHVAWGMARGGSASPEAGGGALG